METETFCPVCGEEQEHEVLAESHDLLVKCMHCGNVHRIPLPDEEKPVSVKTIVSFEETSRICEVELAASEICMIGDRMVAQCGDDYIGVEVTSIECGQKRVNRARPSDISAIWTRRIEEVVVRVSIHDGRNTFPLFLKVSGEEKFEVGMSYQYSGKKFRIIQIKLRDGAVMRKEGWNSVASRIKRIYALPS
ncbi:MAG TPA: HVO_0476 family zinc finger protein [Methanoregulaceae archaeon]|nr:HVO_0476 family zinc finger protein [Methanoregulaceae archaeon]